MSPSDPTPLAQRLRQSILSAWDHETLTEGISSNPDEREVVGSAVDAAGIALVAVLRELTTHPGMVNGHGAWISVDKLATLADSIEKGGGNAD